jgi:hypothetical protein
MNKNHFFFVASLGKRVFFWKKNPQDKNEKLGKVIFIITGKVTIHSKRSNQTA